MTRAPASMHSMIAAASSFGVALGMLFASRGRFGKNGADEERAVGANGGGGGIALRG